MSNRPPAEAAQIADERVVFLLGDRLAAEEAGGRQEKPLNSREYLAGARPEPISEGPH
jgi:hypothetical protein